jgi:hypothetical protein
VYYDNTLEDKIADIRKRIEDIRHRNGWDIEPTTYTPPTSTIVEDSVQTTKRSDLNDLRSKLRKNN